MSEDAFFDDFELIERRVAGASIRLRRGGVGPPLLLIHGHPRTHTTFARVAPLLADRFTVICPDLPGFGRSSLPEGANVATASTKREKARVLETLMRELGHERFAVVGHDRGSYTAFRMAMDHPQSVERLVVIDGVPLSEAFRRCDARFATAWWHWFFFTVPDKPEAAILADPLRWYGGDPQAMGPRNHADFLQAIQDPSVVGTMVEDYRVSPSLDRADDEADLAAGRRLRCPMLCLWTARDDMKTLYGDVLEVWRPWAAELSGGEIDSGHHVAEEAPEALAARLGAFLAPDSLNR